MNLSRRIAKLLDKETIKIMRSAGLTAQANHVNIFLVGGTVRDLLLNTPGLDIDIAVEGDAIAFAGNLARGSRISYYRDFGTATIKMDRLRIDLATTRSEKYKEPGALPEVMPGDIKADLFRRDFTINAMAVSLNPDRFGELIDPYYGYSDLASKLVRVLHQKSFNDDPTRILRAIRYEQRLGFEMEENTLKLLKVNVQMLNIISGDRVRHELEAILKEKIPEKALARASELDVLNNVQTGLNFKPVTANFFQEARALRLSETALFSVYFTLLLHNLKDKELSDILSRLHFNRTLTRDIVQSHRLIRKLPQLIREGASPSEIYTILNKFTPLAVTAVAIVADSPVAKNNIVNYMQSLKDVKPRLNGNDLKKMGVTDGPEIKRILSSLLVARLDGRVTTRQSEIRFVYSNFNLHPGHNGKKKEV